MKNIFQFILSLIAKKIIKKYKPFIIAITGSVGKTSTKEAIFHLLKKEKNIIKSEGNLNTEIGAMLVFLKIKEPGKNTIEWFKIIIKGLNLILKKDKNYPEFIVMEMAADKPGDIDYLTRNIIPDIGVVTGIGDLPVHIEFYKDINEVIKEKSIITKRTKKKGLVILNGDDNNVLRMREGIETSIITYGFNDGSDFIIKDFNVISSKGRIEESNYSIKFKNKEYRVNLSNIFDKGSIYSLSVAMIIGDYLGIYLNDLIDYSKNFNQIKARMNQIKGMKGSYIIDSSYNSSPTSFDLALEVIKSISSERKIGIIGDMLELGEYTEKAHIEAGTKAGRIFDLVFVIGKNKEYFKKGLINNISEEKILLFDKVEDCFSKIKNIIKKEDLILVKGSRGIKLEKVIEEIREKNE